MVDKYLYTLVAFSVTDMIGINRFIKIKNSFTDISEFLECDIKSQMNLLNIKTDKAKTILQNMKKQADYVLEQCHKKSITLIPHNNSLFPPHLKKIIDPPYLLYTKGNLNPNIPLIAVIGTRNTTSDAEKINKWFCKTFVDYGLGIVSGLAKGHDAIASETTLYYKGYAIGVLGTAIDFIYPKSSTNLYYKIQEQGALISEYPPGMAPTKWRFPRRNRIVSGMSQAVFVVQAPEQSGTLITVNMAIDQGKEVYVIPGNPMNPQYKGTNNLLQSGAKIALNPEDIIKDSFKSHSNLDSSLKENSNTLNEKINLSSLSKEEVSILELTKEHINIDELLKILDINIASLNSILTIMEIKGLIIQKPGQLYIRGDI